MATGSCVHLLTADRSSATRSATTRSAACAPTPQRCASATKSCSEVGSNVPFTDMASVARRFGHSAVGTVSYSGAGATHPVSVSMSSEMFLPWPSALPMAKVKTAVRRQHSSEVGAGPHPVGVCAHIRTLYSRREKCQYRHVPTIPGDVVISAHLEWPADAVWLPVSGNRLRGDRQGAASDTRLTEINPGSAPDAGVDTGKIPAANVFGRSTAGFGVRQASRGHGPSSASGMTQMPSARRYACLPVVRTAASRS